MRTGTVSFCQDARVDLRSIEKSKGQESFTSIEGGFLTRGRPLGCKVDCKPNCLTVDSTHSKSPNGPPRLTQSRTAGSSFSVSGRLTRSVQLRGRGIGQEGNRAGFDSGVQSSAKAIPNATVPLGKPIRLAARCARRTGRPSESAHRLGSKNF